MAVVRCGGKARSRGRARVLARAESQGRCYGCGVSVQTDSPENAGYMQHAEWSARASRKQWHLLKCERCKHLDHGQLSAPMVAHDDFRKAVQQLNGIHAVVALIVDCTDLNGSLLGRIRSIVGSNPVYVIATKSDTIPDVALPGEKNHKRKKSNDSTAPTLDFESLEERIFSELQRKRYSVASVAAVSGKSGAGMARATGMLLKARKGRDIWVVGAANVGKSTFVKALLCAIREGGDLSAPSRRLPTTSAMPGTTLGTVRVHTFEDDAKVIDTPGVFLHHRVHHLLTPEDMSTLRVQAPLAVHSLKPPEQADDVAAATDGAWDFADDAIGNDKGFKGLQGHCVCIGGVTRIDVVQAPASMRIVGLLPPGIEAEICEQTAASCDGLGSDAIASAGGLRKTERFELSVGKARSNLADICPSGLGGWVTVWAGGGELNQGTIILDVHVPRGIEVFSRRALPVSTDPHPFFASSEHQQRQPANTAAS